MAKSLSIEYKRGLIIVPHQLELSAQILAQAYKTYSTNSQFLGYKYKLIFGELYKKKLDFVDSVRSYEELNLDLNLSSLYQHQKQALQAWQKTKWGIVNFPTGAGKTHIAIQAIKNVSRSCLVLVPTIDLVEQWHQRLTEAFNQKIGRLGGGKRELEPISVSTYDSAKILARSIGDKFGFMIFDEVHHAAAFKNAKMARYYIAPYRLGLTATMPDDIARTNTLIDIVGGVASSSKTDELTGKYLANYDREIIEVELSAQERADYEENRQLYLDFRYKNNFQDMNNWRGFAIFASRSKEGQKAMKAFFEQKRIAFSPESKFKKLAELLDLYKDSKILIFTNDNPSAKRIAEEHNIGLIIHQTQKKKRAEILNNFKAGKIKQIVSSRVLNEGIDVPDVKLAIIFSGTSTIREFKQRLGRILRKSEAGRAKLIELVSIDTTETYTSKKRNEAFQFS